MFSGLKDKLSEVQKDMRKTITGEGEEGAGTSGPSTPAGSSGAGTPTLPAAMRTSLEAMTKPQLIDAYGKQHVALKRNEQRYKGMWMCACVTVPRREGGEGSGDDLEA